MTDIKFKAWDKKENKMRKIQYLDLIGGFVTFSPRGNKWHPKSEVVLRKFTGIKDKNGKEIYEGDLVKSNIEDITWKVQWNDEKAVFELAYYRGEQPEYYRFLMHLIEDQRMSIIGNIYETTKLLK